MSRADFRHPETRKLYDALMGLRDDLRDELVRIDVVATFDDLPDHAAPNRWFRALAPAGQRARIYVGNGPNLPLSWFTTTPLS